MMTFLQAAEAVATSEETRMGLWKLFSMGGWLMWPLLALGGVTIFIFVERFMAIRKASVLDMNFMNRIRDYISDGKIQTAVNLCKKTDTPIARMIEKGIERIGRPMSDVQTAIENVANLEVSKLENGLPFLATIAGGAPMIGFLGTVLGMVQTFMDMAAAGGTVIEGTGDVKGAPPFVLADLGGTPLVGLPGNPLGAVMIIQRVLLPMLEEDFGLTLPRREVVDATLACDADIDAEGDLCVTLDRNEEGRLVATPVRKGSCRTRLFAVEAGTVSVKPCCLRAGEMVTVERFFN